MRTPLAPVVAVLAAAIFAVARPAHAVQHFYAFVMDGPSENPPNASPGSGTGLAIYDDVAGTLQLTATFAGLNAGVTQTHFHAVTTVSGLPDNNPVGETLSQAAAAVPNAGIAVGNTTLPGFPLGVTSGAYSQTLNLNDPLIYGAGFLAAQGGTAAGARAAFVGALASGRTYWNVHTASPNGFPGGEIRGFPIPVIPEPATMGLATIAFGTLVALRRRK
jgi:hypothetical protein